MRVVLMSLCLIAFALPAAAQTQGPATPGVLDQVYACANITDEAQRLACYDGAVGRLREAQNTGNLVAVDRQQAEQVEREAFGFSLPSLPRLFRRGEDSGSDGQTQAPAIAEVDRVTLEIVRVTENQVGTTRYHMNDGSVWERTGGGNNRAARAGARVEIRRGAVGSYMMYFDVGAAIRVARRS